MLAIFWGHEFFLLAFRLCMFFSWWAIHVAHVKNESKVKHWTLLEKAFA